MQNKTVEKDDDIKDFLSVFDLVSRRNFYFKHFLIL